MAQNQDFSTVINEELKGCENEASNTPINFEKKNVDEFITNNAAEQSMNVEVDEILENDGKECTTIDQDAMKEAVVSKPTITLIDDVQLIQLDDDEHDSIKNEEDDKENIDSQHDSVKTEKKVSHDDENVDSPNDSVKTDEKESIDNDEDVESSTPSTPQGEENILETISKVAPELSQVLDTWNNELSRHKISKDLSDVLDKDPDSDKLLQGENIVEEIKHDVKDKGETLISDIQNSTSKGIKNILDKDPDLDKLLQGEIIYVKEEENQDVKDPDSDKLLQDEITYTNNDVSHIQTLLQPTSNAPSSIITDVVESMFVPGFNRNVVLAIDLVFLLLLSVEGTLAVMTNYNVYVLAHMGITFVLFIALQFFLAEAYRAQVEEVGLIAKKED
ncbi:V-ATPase assembly factor pkr1 [Gigaspora margarita]|uniref:V-ATPase assembly factor pkr1 n=1 Tax=Gigaspora margarita TaxID=4874 RepID=A0A8H3XI86_GIGMA|nr:V-ATPase assembly factor pkr1 [Gigaspora margarita]